MKMVFGCDGELPACMAQAGKTLGADKLLYGTLKKAPVQRRRSTVVALKVLDVKTAVVEKFVNETVQKREVAGSNVNGSAAQAGSAQLLEVEAKPTPDGHVGADRRQRHRRRAGYGAHAADAARSVAGLAHGRAVDAGARCGHAHRRAARGRHRTMSPSRSRPRRPRRGAEAAAQAAGSPQPAAADAAAAPRPVPSSQRAPRPHRQGIVTGVLVGGARGGRRASPSTPGANTRDLAYTAHERSGGAQAAAADGPQERRSSSPTPAATLPARASAQRGGQAKYKSDCDSGKSYANATTGLWVAAGALAAAGVVSYIIGDRQAAKAARRRRAALGGEVAKKRCASRRCSRRAAAGSPACVRVLTTSEQTARMLDGALHDGIHYVDAGPRDADAARAHPRADRHPPLLEAERRRTGAERRRVIAIDLPGFGQLDKPDADYSIDFFVDTLFALLDEKSA